MTKTKLDDLINYLLSERNDLTDIEIPENEQDKFRLYRSLVNIRPAVKADESFLLAEDEYLTGLSQSRGITDIADIAPIEDGVYLWQGDITTLKCGAIVNAANSGMNSHVCGRASAVQMRRDNACAGSRGENGQSKAHACV